MLTSTVASCLRYVRIQGGRPGLRTWTSVNLAMNTGKARGFFKKGDVVIVLTGWRPGSGFTNTMRVVPVP